MDGSPLAALPTALVCPTRPKSNMSRRRSRSISHSGRRQSTIRRLSNVIQKALFVSGQEEEESRDTNGPYLACRPESLSHLCSITKFSRKELQIMYRGFKQGCPTGAVSLERFKEIYSQFFPQANCNPSQYAIYVFNTFDKDKDGLISFEEFVTGLSTLSRGSVEEKLCWIFELYDVDGDSLLTRKDIEQVMSSIYAMIGSAPDPPIEVDTVQKHIDFVIRKMDKDKDDAITLQEFLDVCQGDEGICQSIHLFDTYL